MTPPASFNLSKPINRTESNRVQNESSWVCYTGKQANWVLKHPNRVLVEYYNTFHGGEPSRQRHQARELQAKMGVGSALSSFC